MPAVHVPEPTLPQRLYRWLWTRGAQRERSMARRVRATPQPRHLLVGERGEDEVYWWLRRLGYRVIARRWTDEHVRGDLDLVARDADTLIVVEVKTRTARDAYAAEIAVDRDKQQQLRLMTQAYLRRVRSDERDRLQVRFDVVSVYLLRGRIEVEHTLDAFAFEERP